MATILNTLKALTNYPIPEALIERALTDRGIEASDAYDSMVGRSADFRMTVADIYRFLVDAPNISQDGISFSISDEMRKRYAAKASIIEQQYGGDDDTVGEAQYGSIGNDY